MCIASTPPNFVEVIVRGKFFILERITLTPANLLRSSFGKGFETELYLQYRQFLLGLLFGGRFILAYSASDLV